MFLYNSFWYINNNLYIIYYQNICGLYVRAYPTICPSFTFPHHTFSMSALCEYCELRPNAGKPRKKRLYYQTTCEHVSFGCPTVWRARSFSRAHRLIREPIRETARACTSYTYCTCRRGSACIVVRAKLHRTQSVPETVLWCRRQTLPPFQHCSGYTIHSLFGFMSICLF